MTQRSLSCIPWTVPAALLLALGLQWAWHQQLPLRPGTGAVLAPPPPLALLRLSALGEPIALSRLLMFHVQAADAGSAIRQLDYASVEQWLTRISDLDPRSQYPLTMASHIYADVGDEAGKRRMLEFIHGRFLLDPNRRWPALAHATIVAKHQLHDLPLARRYAGAIRLHASGKGVPDWARQMEIFILEDMDELDSAKILLGALLANGQVTDPQERRFLLERLKAMETK